MVKLTEAGRRNLEAIMVGAPLEIARQHGWTNQRSMAVRSLPDMVLRSTWVVGEGGLDRADGKRLWRELGDGPYLMTLTEIASGRVMNVGVDVEHGIATMTPLTEEQAALMPTVIAQLEEPGIEGRGSEGGDTEQPAGELQN